nr:PREDICTED: zinc finger protein 184-like isoform X2 [Bemisia tabaci]
MSVKGGWCFVSGCMNRNIYQKVHKRTYKKAFFSVPSGEDRNEWIKLCGSKSRSRKRSQVICEDHFTLEKDLENYWQFMNSERLGLPPVKGKLKKGVLPTKFIFHPGKKTSFLESAVPFLSILVEDGTKSSSTTIGHSIDANNDDLVTSPCPNSLSESVKCGDSLNHKSFQFFDEKSSTGTIDVVYDSDFGIKKEIKLEEEVILDCNENKAIIQRDCVSEFTGNMEISVPERPASPDPPKLRILTPNDININSAESTTLTDNVTAAENTDSTEIATGVQIKIEQGDPFNGSEAFQFIDCSGLVKSEVTDDELHSKISIKAKPEELRFAETVTSLSESPETSLKEEQPVEYDCGRGFVCDFCDERFYLKRTLDNHMNKHAKEFYGEIEEDSVYDSMDIETSEYDDDSSYVEKSSESSEDEYSSVVITMNSAEIPSDGKLFICSECTRRYTTAELLERHVCRPVEKRFGCAHCNRHYRNREYLVNHLKMHTNERPFSCSLCGSTFKVRTGLTTHIRVSCKLLVCCYCQKRFRTENERDQHLRKAHIPN